jgi:hypothetical protein
VYCGVAGELIPSLFEKYHRRDVSGITGRIEPRKMDEIMIQFALTAPSLKNGGFEEEQEYRIAGGRVARDKIKWDATRHEKVIKFRSKNGLMVPYIELFKSSRLPLPIKAIIIGPHPSQDKQEIAVRMVLKSTPFAAAEVRRSDIPLG